MTSAARRRVDKLEAALPPLEAVLAWLVEAHQFTSLDDHLRQVVELPLEAAPLSVIGRRVEAAVRASTKGQPRTAVDDAIRRALGDAVFLFCLVLQLNVQTVEIARVEGLRASAVFFWMRSILGDLEAEEAREHEHGRADSWARWRSVVDRMGHDVLVEVGARAVLEREYLGGHDVLFADAHAAWASYADQVERITRMSELLQESGVAKRRKRSPSAKSTAASISDRVAFRVGMLVDDAKVRAYEVLDDRPQAVAIMEHRLMAAWAPAGGDVPG